MTGADGVWRDPVGKFELSEHLPYLLKHIHSQLQGAAEFHLAEFGVSIAVWRILAVLWEHGDLSHRELADLTAIEVSTLSRISKSAKRDGLISRKRTQEDQRTVRVTLTEKGRSLTRAIIPSALNWQAETVGNLSVEDVESVTRMLHVIVDNLKAYATSDAENDDAPDPGLRGRPRPVRAGLAEHQIEPSVIQHSDHAVSGGEGCS